MGDLPNYFELLGLPSRLVVDPIVLGERFRALSRESHPDRFPNAAPEQRAVALMRSSQLNDAFRTLREPWLLAEYAVSLSRPETGDATKPPVALFEQLMEIQEALMEFEEAKMEGDELAISSLRSRIEASKAEIEAEFSGMEARRDAIFRRCDAGEAEAIGELEALLGERRYLRRILLTVDAKTA